MTAINQDFAIPQGDSVTVRIDVGPEPPGATGLDWVWRAFPLVNCIPDLDAALIEKTSDAGGIVVTNLDAQTADLLLEEADTLALLGNYYHNLSLEDAAGAFLTVTHGIMTVEPGSKPSLTTRTKLTAIDLKQRFPEFADVAPARVVFALEDAARWTNGWAAADKNRATLLLAAHLLWSEGALTAPGAPLQSLVGPMTSYSLGDASISYASRGGSGPVIGGLASDLSRTAYGQAYLRILRAVRGGPRVLGQA